MSLLQDYQSTQSGLETAVESRQRLESQLNENEQVKKEFDQLKAHNTIYKLIGPVLVKQEQAEAKINVNTRIDFIKGELKRVEVQIKELEEKGEKQRSGLVKQQQVQQEGQANLA